MMHDDLEQGERELDDDSPPRVRINSNRLPSEHVDGAWWPRSAQLIAELPALLSSVSDRLGEVVAVGYPRGGWVDVPPRVDIGGQPVQLLGLTSHDPAVIVIGRDGHHLTLRVIAPEVSDEAAQEAFARTTERANGAAVGRPTVSPRTVADVAERLAGHEGRHDDERNAEIMRWCIEAAEQFDAAPIQSFVPILVEHEVHNRMTETRTAESIPSEGAH